APQVPLSLAVATTHFRYNPPANRLLTTGNTSTGASFTYDAQGQTINKNGTPYSWDYEHRLISQGSDQYFYDGVGNRLKAIHNGITTKYIYDARGHLIAEADASNAITRYYIYGAGLLAMVKNNNVYTYHHNAIGSTVAITNNSKTIINAYSYTPYGQIVDQKETIPQPFKYVGKYGVMTEAHGLYYMRARYYDPSTGRFISEDPKGFEGGQVNLYAYVGGNPVIFVDPNGLTKLGDFGRGLGIILFTNVPRVDSAIEKRLVENYFIGNGDDFYLTPSETIRFRQNPGSTEFDFGIGHVSDPLASGLLDRYDFNAGNRKFYPEAATRIAGAIGPLLGGKDFNVYTALGK
ncbi:Rhs-family protein, partial [hydrothermal vent metagenome]